MIETHNDQQKELEASGQERREKLLDQLAETLELVSEGKAEISALRSKLKHFDKENLVEVDAEQALNHFQEKHHVLMVGENDIKLSARRHPAQRYFRQFTAIIVAAVFFGTIYVFRLQFYSF